jgi:hypothetical protein
MCLHIRAGFGPLLQIRASKNLGPQFFLVVCWGCSSKQEAQKVNVSNKYDLFVGGVVEYDLFLLVTTMIITFDIIDMFTIWIYSYYVFFIKKIIYFLLGSIIIISTGPRNSRRRPCFIYQLMFLEKLVHENDIIFILYTILLRLQLCTLVTKQQNLDKLVFLWYFLVSHILNKSA